MQLVYVWYGSTVRVCTFQWWYRTMRRVFTCWWNIRPLPICSTSSTWRDISANPTYVVVTSLVNWRELRQIIIVLKMRLLWKEGQSAREKTSATYSQKFSCVASGGETRGGGSRLTEVYHPNTPVSTAIETEVVMQFVAFILHVVDVHLKLKAASVNVDN